MEYYSAIKKNTFESVLMRWMKLEPIIQSDTNIFLELPVSLAPSWPERAQDRMKHEVPCPVELIS